MLYLIAVILFAVFVVLWLIVRRLDTVIALIGGRAVVVEDDKTTLPPQRQLPPSNVYSRHNEIIDKWKHGG